MKKIILFLSFILSASIVFAQYPITQYLGSDSALVKARSALSTGAGLINGFYKDTTSANLTHISQYPHAQIIVGDVLYIRDSTATRWISSHNGGSGIDSAAYHTTTQINDTTIKQTKPNGDGTVWQFIGGGTGSGQVNADWNATSGKAQILNKPIINSNFTNGIIDPLLVTWSGQSLIFDISAGSFIFNNVVHNVSETKDTLSAADVTYPRIDAFYVDTLGNIGHITGVAQANPVAPQTTYGQFLLTTVYLNANSTTPPNVNLTTIYDENTEWTTSSSGTGVIDFNNTVNPYHLTKAIKVTSQSAGFAMIFTNPSGIDTAGIGDVLKFFIYTATNLSNGYTFQFYSGSNAVSTPLVITQPGYGYNPFLTGTYQNVSIPLSAFTFYSPYYNAIKITANGSNANPVYWDYVQIQRGVYQFAPTDYSNKLDSVTNVGGNLYQWTKGSSKFIAPLGVHSVTGTTVDNTDPLNPVVITPNFNKVADASHEGFDDFAKMDDKALMAMDNTNSGTVFLGVGNSDLSKIIQIGSEYGTGNPLLSYSVGANSLIVKADSVTGGGHILYLPSNDGTLVSTINGNHPDKYGNTNIGSGYVNDTTANKPLVIDATGNIHQSSWLGAGGGSGTYTASNGLIMSGSDVQLGGTLTSSTNISAGTYGLSISGAPTLADVLTLNNTGNSRALFVQNSGVSPAVYITSSNSNGLYSYSGNGYGIFANSNTVGLQAQGSTLAANLFTVSTTNDNTVKTTINLTRSTSGTAGNGIGQSIDFYTTSGADNLTNQLISKWTDANSSTRTSEFSITGVNNAVTGNILRIGGNGNAQFYGAVQLKNYTVATLPTGVQGMAAYVTDAAATPTWGGTATGGGSIVAKVFYNGTSWIYE